MYRLRALGSALVLGLACAAGAPAQEFPLSDGVFDWPVGQTNGDGDLVPSRGFYVHQNFGNLDGPEDLVVCGRAHAGVDLEVSRDEDGTVSGGDAETEGQNVYATADGRVLCTFEFADGGEEKGYPGRTLVVEHRLPDQSTVYSHYAHLADCETTSTGCPETGDDLTRGDLVGTILDQGDDSHLHFEIRTFPYWNMTSGEEGPAQEPTPATDAKSCPGRGYAYSKSAALDAGYLDPVSFILGHRPPLPETVQVRADGGVVLEATPEDTAIAAQPPTESGEWTDSAGGTLYVIGESETVRPIALFRAPDFHCQATDQETTGNALDYRVEQNACNTSKVTHGYGTDCQDGACDWWYQVEYDDPEGTARAGYIKAFEKSFAHYGLTRVVHWLKGNAYRSVILVGEERQAADPWEDPEEDPLIDYRFDAAIDNDAVANSGSLEVMNGRVAGPVTLTDFDDDGVDRALGLDGADSYLEVTLSEGLGSEENGFHLDTWIDRQSRATVDVIASQWSHDPEARRWRLEVLPRDDAEGVYYDELRFTLLRRDLGEVVARFPLPDCTHVDAWARVSASYDPQGDEIRLYWNGRPVARADLDGDPLVEALVPLRLGGTADDTPADDRRFHGRLDKFRFWSTNPLPNVDTVLILDSSGSMVWNDPTDRRRDAAKSYLGAALAGDHVGVVDFDFSARVASPLRRLPDERAALEAAVDSVDSRGGTHLGRGLAAGCSVLLDAASGSTNSIKAAIMLTDGDGDYFGEAQCFADQGWPVYTFGLGEDNDSVDDQVLTEIAEATGGVYQRLPAGEMVCEFQRVRAVIVGGTAADCVEQQVMSGETVSSDVVVDLGVGEATFNTSWPGSDVVMTLTAPSGRVIGRDTTAADVFHNVGPTWEVYTIIDPEPGLWRVDLFGADVPPAGEPVTFGFNSLPGVTPACERPGEPGNWLHCTPECPCGEGLGDCNDDSECLPGLSCANNVGGAYSWSAEIDVCRSDCHDGFPGDWLHCTSECPCGEGLGDCNDDADCLPGLFCAANTGGLYGWNGEVDVCSSDCHNGFPGNWGYCSTACPCEEGLGDCNSDAECAPGLYCVDNAGRNLDLPSGIDVCSSDCHNGFPGNWGYCNPGCPCEEEFGDCNDDSECAAGLRCANNVGPLHGFAAGIDVCTSDCHDGLPGGWGYCTPGCPCAAGQGDCNSDTDCQAGLTCVDNVGAQYGWGGGIDVCEMP